jgi:hypothetical protein
MIDLLRDLIEKYLSAELGAEDFCGKFETEYNFGETQTSDSRRKYEALFDVVTRYSPFDDEVARIPNYIGEAELAATVRAFAEGLRAR